MTDAPHRRRNALTGEWVSVSPHRTQRPWQGRVEAVAAAAGPEYDPTCYLCPGNARSGGQRNPPYASTFAFTNDFPAFLPARAEVATTDVLLQADAHAGTCRVLCYSPRHDLALGNLPLPRIEAVIDLWADETAALAREYRWVQVFENRGQAMGASNPHPHGQVWATTALPNEPAKELAMQRAWLAARGTTLLADYARLELERAERVVVRTERWLAVVPWWAVWPFETLIVPLEPARSMPELSRAMRTDLAILLRRLLSGYDRVFDAPFPYSMGWHGSPSDGTAADGSVLHAHVYPPLLRSATVRKFFVGYEMLAEPQRDITPEQAAERLRQVV
jgi:UDPglucose--hexose-1-phosphate uridylyltransferase